MKVRALAVATFLSAATIAGSAWGTATVTNVTGAWPMDGIDWAQGGTAYTVGFVPTATDTFTLDYFAVATAFVLGGNNYVPTGMDTIANGAPGPIPPAIPFTGNQYEYTIVASLDETVVGCTATTCTFDVTGGTFSIYYDTASDANALAGQLGTGFADGTLLIQGTVNPLAGQTFNTVTGSNSTTLTGDITFTSPLINPALLGTTFTSTLQIGSAVTAWVNPGGFGGTAFSALQPSAADVVFQADANQSFTTVPTVPEPATLALLGLGLGAMGWSVRRKRS